MKSCAVDSLTWDTEYLGGYIQRVEHYDRWNERVSCRHPIYCTRCNGAGKNRFCYTYVCGHIHPYDVDDHPEHWVAVTTFGGFGITQERYRKLKLQFGGDELFQDMHRKYHTIDGDMHYVDWDKQVQSIEPCVETEHYENRPQASHNVFHYEPLDSTDRKRYGVYEYPSIYDNKQHVLLGITDRVAEQKLHYFNGVFGKSKQVRLYVLIFHNLPREAGIAQEHHWANGNKNEIVVCVGKRGDKVAWVHPFSWTDNKELLVETQHGIESLSTFDADSIADISITTAHKWWKRKSFHDFDYLDIPLTGIQLFWIYFTTVAVNIAVAIFVVKNEVDPED
jgi:hypothetical protein